jgi:CII-binding regulator of phage lambda lysogenization HflD
MTNNFLTDVEKNAKIQKLFSKPEFMQAVSEFQTNPKEAMAKYGHNQELMEGFKEFMKLMGTQFQNLAQTQKK